jgi:hypothetical protein
MKESQLSHPCKNLLEPVLHGLGCDAEGAKAGHPRRGNGVRQALTAKMAHNAPFEKSRSSKHRDNSISHCSRSTSHAQRLRWPPRLCNLAAGG